MAPNYSLPAGTPAGGPFAPPLDPQALHALLRHQPRRAFAVLAAMRPAARHAQLLAQAVLAEALPERLQAEWGELLRHAHPIIAHDLPPAAPIEPETLAIAEPDEARRLIAALTPAHRVRQAIVQASWLNSYDYPVVFEELLALWETDLERAAT